MPQLNPQIFRAYDIRGVAGTDLIPQTSELLGRGYGTLIRRISGPRVAVGRDNRPSSEELQRAFMRGAAAAGCQVIDIGLSLSPMLYFAVCYLGLDGGVNVTGSHNPVQYNGFKLTARDAVPVAEDEIQEIRRIIEAGAFDARAAQARVETRSIAEDYLREVSSRVKLHRSLKVVLDTGNGTAGLFAPQLFQRLGCQVIELFCESDGTFPHHLPDPEVEEYLEDLKSEVVRQGADFGIAIDGDGDRLGVIDEKGQRHEADEVLILLARDFLRRHPGERVIMDVKCSQVLVDDVKAHGGQPVMWKTGHSLLKKKMREDGILLGGEVSGHMFFKEDWYGFDDALLASAKLMEFVSREPLPISAHWRGLPQVASTPELKAPVPDEEKFEVVEKVAAHFKSRYPDSLDIDGLRIRFPDGWGLVRASNTNPYLTLRFEAPTQERLEEIKREVYSVLSGYPSVKLPG
jgi:phosphomannomutase/phosphoglucomutase